MISRSRTWYSCPEGPVYEYWCAANGLAANSQVCGLYRWGELWRVIALRNGRIATQTCFRYVVSAPGLYSAVRDGRLDIFGGSR